MATAPRFGRASSPLSLKTLLLRPRRSLSISLLLGLAAHLSLTQLGGSQYEQKPAKPLTTQFVKRRPRLTKPLELKKRPMPRPREIERRMVSVRVRRRSGSVAVLPQPADLVGRLALSRAHLDRGVSSVAADAAPQVLADVVAGTRSPRDRIDMSLEMVDIDALDTGRYQAMVIQDPNDKRNIKGYLHLAVACPFSLRMRDWHNVEDRMMNGVRRLVDRLNEWTDVEAGLTRRVPFDSKEFLETLWVYLWVLFAMEPTQGELESLGRYLLGGGFFFFEGARLEEYQGERYVVDFVRLALESQGFREGVAWEFQFLPNTHTLFHCYYEFPDGVPIGRSLISKNYWGSLGRDDGVEPWSRGIEIDGRLVALNTNQGFCNPWSDWGNTTAPHARDAYSQFDPTRQFEFGINTIIFALTQEGSITHRLMDRVR